LQVASVLGDIGGKPFKYPEERLFEDGLSKEKENARWEGGGGRREK
jgi:hypothetical protein